MKLEFILRMLLATACGTFIGMERRTRLKEAGIRTHILVAIGSCLIMLVSKYGFYDLVETTGKVDGARLAAQVVTGVGFLGAGMIMTKNNVVVGLTTAAGIWTTSGVGLAIGAGMYGVGIFCTFLILVIQAVLHSSLFGPSIHTPEHIVATLKEKQNIKQFNEFLDEHNIQVLDFNYEEDKRELTIVSYQAFIPRNLSHKQLIEETADLDYVKGIEI